MGWVWGPQVGFKRQAKWGPRERTFNWGEPQDQGGIRWFGLVLACIKEKSIVQAPWGTNLIPRESDLCMVRDPSVINLITKGNLGKPTGKVSQRQACWSPGELPGESKKVGSFRLWGWGG